MNMATKSPREIVDETIKRTDEIVRESMKITKTVEVEITIPTGVYANAKPTISVEIPKYLSPVQEFYYLWDMFHNLSERRPKDTQTKAEDYLKGKYGELKARKEGFAVDNSSYLDGEEDEGAKLENMERVNRP